jgi:peptide chain release factor 1
MEAPRKVDVTIPDHELEISTCKGSGPGGQHRNKTETTVIVKHKPTGIAVRCGGERSQLLNKQTAIRLLAARIIASRTEAAQSSTNKNRKQQVGTGMRADKVRTVQVRNGLVINHLNGKKMPLERYLKGHLEAIL